MSLQHDTEATSPAGDDAIEVVQNVPRPVGEVWARLTTREGIEAFLGEGATLGAKGDPWHAADGTRGLGFVGAGATLRKGAALHTIQIAELLV